MTPTARRSRLAFLQQFMSLGMALLLAGCSASEPGSTSISGTAKGKPRIALIMKSLANEFFSTMA